MTRTMDYEQIRSILPHRYPFLLVDRVVDYRENEWILAYKNVTGNEAFFQGHFPSRAVMPGVMIVEAMAQAGGILLLKSRSEENSLVYFTSIEKARFRKPVRPGDRMEMEVEVLRLRSSYCKLKGVAKVEGAVVAEAVFSSALSVD